MEGESELYRQGRKEIFEVKMSGFDCGGGDINLHTMRWQGNTHTHTHTHPCYMWTQWRLHAVCGLYQRQLPAINILLRVVQDNTTGDSWVGVCGIALYYFCSFLWHYNYFKLKNCKKKISHGYEQFLTALIKSYSTETCYITFLHEQDKHHRHLTKLRIYKGLRSYLWVKLCKVISLFREV